MAAPTGVIPSENDVVVRRGRRVREGLVRAFCWSSAAISVATTLGIVLILVTQSLPFFQKVSVWEFLSGTVWSPVIQPRQFGVLPLLTGTLLITVGSAFISIPIGLLSAIYLSEYAPSAVRNFLKPALELLAGIPTVVYGYIAIFFITPYLQLLIPGVMKFNAAAAAIVVGIMTLPMVSSLCEDALRAVPRSLREGGYALGATRFEVVAKIVVPAALSGIVASFILALSRAIGETMAVTLAAGAMPNLTLDFRESVQTMTAFIVVTSKGDAPRGSIQYESIFAVGLALFLITLALNLLAERFVRRYRQVYT